MYFVFTEGTADLVAIRIISVRINGVLMYFALTEGTADLVTIRIISVRMSGVIMYFAFAEGRENLRSFQFATVCSSKDSRIAECRYADHQTHVATKLQTVLAHFIPIRATHMHPSVTQYELNQGGSSTL